MKNCGEIIERALNANNVKRKDFCEYIEMTPQNLTKLLRKTSLDARLLERCCEFLKLNPADFFDYSPESGDGSVLVGSIDQSVMIGEAKVCLKDTDGTLISQLIAEKDARIAHLEQAMLTLLTKLPDGSAVTHAPQKQ